MAIVNDKDRFSRKNWASAPRKPFENRDSKREERAKPEAPLGSFDRSSKPELTRIERPQSADRGQMPKFSNKPGQPVPGTKDGGRDFTRNSVERPAANHPIKHWHRDLTKHPGYRPGGSESGRGNNNARPWFDKTRKFGGAADQSQNKPGQGWRHGNRKSDGRGQGYNKRPFAPKVADYTKKENVMGLLRLKNLPKEFNKDKSWSPRPYNPKFTPFWKRVHIERAAKMREVWAEEAKKLPKLSLLKGQGNQRADSNYLPLILDRPAAKGATPEQVKAFSKLQALSKPAAARKRLSLQKLGAGKLSKLAVNLKRDAMINKASVAAVENQCFVEKHYQRDLAGKFSKESLFRFMMLASKFKKRVEGGEKKNLDSFRMNIKSLRAALPDSAKKGAAKNLKMRRGGLTAKKRAQRAQQIAQFFRMEELERLAGYKIETKPNGTVAISRPSLLRDAPSGIPAYKSPKKPKPGEPRRRPIPEHPRYKYYLKRRDPRRWDKKKLFGWIRKYTRLIDFNSGFLGFKLEKEFYSQPTTASRRAGFAYVYRKLLPRLRGKYLVERPAGRSGLNRLYPSHKFSSFLRLLFWPFPADVKLSAAGIAELKALRCRNKGKLKGIFGPKRNFMDRLRELLSPETANGYLDQFRRLLVERTGLLFTPRAWVLQNLKEHRALLLSEKILAGSSRSGLFHLPPYLHNSLRIRLNGAYQAGLAIGNPDGQLGFGRFYSRLLAKYPGKRFGINAAASLSAYQRFAPQMLRSKFFALGPFVKLNSYFLKLISVVERSFFAQPRSFPQALSLAGHKQPRHFQFLPALLTVLQLLLGLRNSKGLHELITLYTDRFFSNTERRRVQFPIFFGFPQLMVSRYSSMKGYKAAMARVARAVGFRGALTSRRLQTLLTRRATETNGGRLWFNEEFVQSNFFKFLRFDEVYFLLGEGKALFKRLKAFFRANRRKLKALQQHHLLTFGTDMLSPFAKINFIFSRLRALSAIRDNELEGSAAGPALKRLRTIRYIYCDPLRGYKLAKKRFTRAEFDHLPLWQSRKGLPRGRLGANYHFFDSQTYLKLAARHLYAEFRRKAPPILLRTRLAIRPTVKKKLMAITKKRSSRVGLRRLIAKPVSGKLKPGRLRSGRKVLLISKSTGLKGKRPALRRITLYPTLRRRTIRGNSLAAFGIALRHFLKLRDQLLKGGVPSKLMANAMVPRHFCGALSAGAVGDKILSLSKGLNAFLAHYAYSYLLGLAFLATNNVRFLGASVQARRVATAKRKMLNSKRAGSNATVGRKRVKKETVKIRGKVYKTKKQQPTELKPSKMDVLNRKFIVKVTKLITRQYRCWIKGKLNFFVIRKKLGLVLLRYKTAKSANTSSQVHALSFRHVLAANSPELEKAHMSRRRALATKLFGGRKLKVPQVKVSKPLRVYSMLCSRSDLLNRRAVLLHGLVDALSEFHGRVTNLEVTEIGRGLFRGILLKLRSTIKGTAELRALERWVRPRQAVIAAQNARVQKFAPELRRRFGRKRSAWWSNKREEIAQKIAQRKSKKAQPELSGAATISRSQSQVSSRRPKSFSGRGFGPAATCPTAEPSGDPVPDNSGMGSYYYRLYYGKDKNSYQECVHWLGPNWLPKGAVRLTDPKAESFRAVPLKPPFSGKPRQRNTR